MLPVAAVKVHAGASYADYTTPLPNALVLRWLVLRHSRWGSAESIESILVGQDSPLVLPVAAEKCMLALHTLTIQRLSQTLWCRAGCDAGWRFSTPNTAARKVLNRP